MAELNIVEAVNSAFFSEMKRDEDVILVGEDVGKDGGVFRATQGLLKKFGPKRVIDTPLSESGIVGTAFGMALYGLKPVAEIQFSGFIYPAFDQIISHIARIRNRSRGRFHAQMVIRAPYSGGIHAPEHHSESMEAIYVHTPGVKVIIPSTPYDAKGLLISAIRDPDPVIFLEPKKIYRAFKQEVPENAYEIPLEKARVAREGDDVTVVSWGSMMVPCLEAAQQLEGKGKSVEVIDLRSLSPLDEETLVGSVEKTGRLVVVQEAPRTLGLASEIIAIVNDHAMLSLEAPVERVTGFDVVFPLYRLEGFYLPNARRIVTAIEKVLSYR
ncbi:MAG: pyruvate dehydrogenase E1 component subunit beta [archaeon GW2011_AR10]|uniref:Alpha-ketoacid dehydrogenase subunit beta n=1 Tax=Candidatus Iainarchaeum sp. TaxID=3101447 RepID=A0A7J4IWL8_9ARCH|nr:MAG: pyruvate dehydrogenase E1 component subunit beta [archaeon GW2011_AR10]HIH08655.1 alpha-ketoacid dehydrogenase subunit beta [Candidatus Diapherotrites archaeon]